MARRGSQCLVCQDNPALRPADTRGKGKNNLVPNSNRLSNSPPKNANSPSTPASPQILHIHGPPIRQDNSNRGKARRQSRRAGMGLSSTLPLATKSSYKKDGKYISHTEWHRCVVFGKLAEFAGTLKKGAHLQVEGELRSREYDSKKAGTKQTIWEIRLNSVLKLDRAEKSNPEEQEHEDVNTEETAA
jgi:single-strand DNA-binding protein